MSEEKFTPGPWEACKTDVDSLWICGGKDKTFVVASVQGNSNNIGVKNAHLIAAAPEMFDLLDQIREVFENNCCIPCSKCHELQGKIEAVIEKARGEKC